ncbi:copper-binding protein [Streptomyces sp. uw30]|uniref:plastocyanin/azurin family copper-binding protein n=1 Tax=Streptomyces sp. uw30 TaxID=1828179 RepID=UPI0011CD3B5C|nr:plastocyanin/azurin family copper-binding protein [Streptomyces sp. uw30]TXS40505.1 copper-binding protein [Streptomyces sp. uw30]
MTIPHIRHRVLLGVAAGGLTAVLAACGGGGNGSSSSGNSSNSTGTGTGPGTQVTAEMTDFHIKLSTQKFQPGEYTFTAKNMGGHTHALEIEGPGGENRSKNMEPGQSTTLTVKLKSGSYEVYCPVDGHKDLGMKTEITVGGAPAPSGNDNTSPSNGY